MFYSPDFTEAELAAACDPNPSQRRRADPWKLATWLLGVSLGLVEIGVGYGLGRYLSPAPPALTTSCHIRAPLFTGLPVHIHPAFPQGF